MAESLQQLVARINAGAFLFEEPTAVLKSRKKRGKVDTRRRMGDAKLDELVAAMVAKATAVEVAGEKYVYVPGADKGWHVCGPSGTWHTIVDGKCSCEDCFYRKNRCKHLENMPNGL